jgi:hypothetical protein
VTQTKQPPENPERFTFVARDQAFQTDAITIDWYRFLRFETQRGG